MKLKKVYAAGGGLDMGLISAVQGIGTSMVDAIDPPDENGQQSMLGSLFKGNLQGGPLGMLTSFINHRRQTKEIGRVKREESDRKIRTAMDRYSAQATANPDIAQGTPGGGYFANGGTLFSNFVNRKMNGGSLSTLSSDTVEVKGNSHAQGGVTLTSGEEVENGETIKGNYVLSDKLGFAQAHKPLAKAIGILEKKAPTRSVLNSIERLREKEQALILFQEAYRKKHNLA